MRKQSKFEGEGVFSRENAQFSREKPLFPRENRISLHFSLDNHFCFSIIVPVRQEYRSLYKPFFWRTKNGQEKNHQESD